MRWKISNHLLKGESGMRNMKKMLLTALMALFGLSVIPAQAGYRKKSAQKPMQKKRSRYKKKDKRTKKDSRKKKKKVEKIKCNICGKKYKRGERHIDSPFKIALHKIEQRIRQLEDEKKELRKQEKRDRKKRKNRKIKQKDKKPSKYKKHKKGKKTKFISCNICNKRYREGERHTHKARQPKMMCGACGMPKGKCVCPRK